MNDPTPDQIQEEGDADRLFYGIDGTMGDAQDKPHPFIASVYGTWCSLCGMKKAYRKHAQ